jgi:hypothetical protein
VRRGLRAWEDGGGDALLGRRQWVVEGQGEQITLDEDMRGEVARAVVGTLARGQGSSRE